MARPKVPKNRTGVPPVPRHPDPETATLDCAFTEHCSVPWRTAKRGRLISLPLGGKVLSAGEADEGAGPQAVMICLRRDIFAAQM